MGARRVERKEMGTVHSSAVHLLKKDGTIIRDGRVTGDFVGLKAGVVCFLIEEILIMD